jgi:hypothetical protein
MTQRFTVVAETTDGKLSAPSNDVAITPVDVPGAVSDIRYVVDQNRIQLEWELPGENPVLADAYIVNEVGEDGETASPAVVSVRRYEDVLYETGKRYTYTVTPIRRSDQGEVPGIPSGPVDVIATDRTPPGAPTGLEIVPAGAYLTWTENPERDLAGYRIFRSANPDSGFSRLAEDLRSSTGIFDAGYQSGLYYVVTAVDESGNESEPSLPVRAP